MGKGFTYTVDPHRYSISRMKIVYRPIIQFLDPLMDYYLGLLSLYNVCMTVQTFLQVYVEVERRCWRMRCFRWFSQSEYNYKALMQYFTTRKQILQRCVCESGIRDQKSGILWKPTAVSRFWKLYQDKVLKEKCLFGINELSSLTWNIKIRFIQSYCVPVIFTTLIFRSSRPV